MINHLSIDRGRIVEPRHLHLVASNDWPDHEDTDTHYADDGNPLAAAFWCIVLSLFLGFIGWVVFL